MSDRVFLIHGWSVTESKTYRALHVQLARHGFALEDIYLGRYVSLDDRVEIVDVARALHNELSRRLGPPPWKGPIHFVTHSTGALIVKHWIHDYYQEDFAKGKPLKNVVFLAGPHFGSRLAHHGRSMLAHAAYFGATGDRILTSLELGSSFSWENNGRWLEASTWKKKGIRPFCLTGDRVERSFMKSRIFPAGYEKGSDMVVRVPAANLNFRRFVLDGRSGAARKVGEISGVPFGAFSEYVHSGPKNGIMNNISSRADPGSLRWQNLRAILDCLAVGNADEYEAVREQLRKQTAETRKKRSSFSQLDFRFRDNEDLPIEDFSVILGAIVKGTDRASKTVADTHKNRAAPSHFTAFIDRSEFEPKYTYYLEIDASSGTNLFGYSPDPFRIEFDAETIKAMIAPDQTTQIDVILDRRASGKLFVFHRGDDEDLHMEWDREGDVSKKRMPID